MHMPQQKTSPDHAVASTLVQGQQHAVISCARLSKVSACGRHLCLMRMLMPASWPAHSASCWGLPRIMVLARQLRKRCKRVRQPPRLHDLPHTRCQALSGAQAEQQAAQPVTKAHTKALRGPRQGAPRGADPGHADGCRLAASLHIVTLVPWHNGTLAFW